MSPRNMAVFSHFMATLYFIDKAAGVQFDAPGSLFHGTLAGCIGTFPFPTD